MMNLTKLEFKEIVSNEHELRALLGEPSKLAGNKVINGRTPFITFSLILILD
jgi:hypothetical protein